MDLERLHPTKNNLQEILQQFPDHKQRYELAKNYAINLVVADIACGAGYGSYLISSVAKIVHGYDIDIQAISHAKKNFKTNNNDFFLYENSLKKDYYDLAVSFETLEHMDEKDGDIFLENIFKSLKGGGILLISTPINRMKNKVNVTPFHLREYSDDEFIEKLKKNGFKIEKMLGQGGSTQVILHKKSFGVSIFAVLKSGLHKIIPKIIRRFVWNKFFNSNNSSLTISEDNWRNQAIQIAVCRK